MGECFYEKLEPRFEGGKPRCQMFLTEKSPVYE